MFILNQEGGVLNEKQISDDDVKAMLKYNNIGNKYMKKDTEEREREWRYSEATSFIHQK